MDRHLVDAPYVFVSYSRQDARIVDKLVDALDMHGIKVWIDRRDISAGNAWTGEVADAIARSAMILFVATAASAASDHVLMELQFARAYKQKTILPLFLDNPELSNELAFLVGVSHRLEGVGRDFESVLGKLINQVLRALEVAATTDVSAESVHFLKANPIASLALIHDPSLAALGKALALAWPHSAKHFVTDIEVAKSVRGRRWDERSSRVNFREGKQESLADVQIRLNSRGPGFGILQLSRPIAGLPLPLLSVIQGKAEKSSVHALGWRSVERAVQGIADSSWRQELIWLKETVALDDSGSRILPSLTSAFVAIGTPVWTSDQRAIGMVNSCSEQGSVLTLIDSGLAD